MTRRYRFRPGLVEMTPRSSARPLGRGQRVTAGDHLLELGEHPLAVGGVPLRGLGVEADYEPFVLGDADLLDPQVRRDVLVAALP